MATLQAHNLILSSSSSSAAAAPKQHGLRFKARLQNRSFDVQKLNNMLNVQELRIRERNSNIIINKPQTISDDKDVDMLLVSKLYAIAEAAGDRAEMHKIIGEQRDNWNTLLLNSINSINLIASIMAGLSTISMGDQSPHFLAFKLSSALLFTAATGMMLIVNKIQPSQLAEEQRNATRLFKQLERSIHTSLDQLQSTTTSTPTELDVEEAMEKVLALDKAYPLPLLPGMLEKFPKNVEPTVWWPKLQTKRRSSSSAQDGKIWNKEFEGKMRGLLKVLKEKDEEQYVWHGNLFVKINKCLAISGPLLAGLGAVGAGLIGTPALGQWPVLFGVMGGVLATIINTMEHGFQIGMLIEMFRNCAGFYRKLEEEIIEFNSEESCQEDIEMFDMNMALQLGRRVSELEDFASCSSPSVNANEFQGFAGKLF
ncbi:probable F-box protein At4g22030 [Dioscorea cayenensis subsp. rotundata]|uniref:Probable F-box protein At4g22030 n=1 Tax=Dioscorea cayennensis subsp. rotundata TaxID=55577 RepID=A0AB40CVA0_DIOCR|nr:probable F-box protein At4g22030 [Dioscorea cayenensis subsp. rotundata]